MQLPVVDVAPDPLFNVEPMKGQLLKWIGNKQRFAHEIISCFPSKFGRYFEPFLGSGAVLGTLAPLDGVGSDCFSPLMEIWHVLKEDPEKLIRWYSERWDYMMTCGKKEGYEAVKARYNAAPNAADLLFLSRSCYGGVMRFRKTDGYMSTPCGVHSPMPPDNFSKRVYDWHKRTQGTSFKCIDFSDAMEMAKPGDLIYCDPPYSHSQTILYGAQSFTLSDLFSAIDRCKKRGVYVALSIDGHKKSGKHQCSLPIPERLFEREVYVNCGRSMLKRFQMEGQSLEGEVVADRLLLTY
ncbi:DNA adenine methylase [Geotalea sp. SG265]|uniref:DNA adenine methylase n=1 Tax=Geotalea sp. SG265 TaxID=2922867 RepID=UPI001FAF63E3|nr:DNA adenine methylase [Geotalea sp. SG265]